MHSTKFLKLRFVYTKGKNISIAEMLSRSLTRKELRLNILKHNQFSPLTLQPISQH